MKRSSIFFFSFLLLFSVVGSIHAEQCRAGYIVGFANNIKEVNDWGVWLSDERFSAVKKRFFLASRDLTIEKHAGKGAFSALMSAYANGQLVTFASDNCNASDAMLIGAAKNPVQFKSFEANDAR